MAEQACWIGSVPGIGGQPAGDAQRAGCIDAQLGELHLADLILETLRDLLDGLRRSGSRLSRALGIGEDHDELVAADSADPVALADHRVQQPHGLAQHLIAGMVSELIVVVFEVVEVEDHHRYRSAHAGSFGHGLLHEDFVEPPVPRSGQLVVKGHLSVVAEVSIQGQPSRQPICPRPQLRNAAPA